MADVLSVSTVQMSKIATLSGYHTSSIPVTSVSIPYLSYTNAGNTHSIVFQTVKHVNNVVDNKGNSTPISNTYKPGKDYSNAYPVTPLSSYSGWKWTVGQTVDVNSDITVRIGGYLDHMVSLWMRINGDSNSAGIPRCYPVANVYEPAGGKHTRRQTSTFNLQYFSLTGGEVLDFFIGAGPYTAGTGYYWADFTCTAYTTQVSSLSVSPNPVRISEYRHQDFDIPSAGSPIRFSDFKGAVNYLPNTLLSFYNVSSNYKTPLCYTSKGRLILYTSNTIYLGDLNANSIIRTKGAPVAAATNSKGLSSSTYAMLDADIDVLISCTDREDDGDADDEFGLFFQKNTLGTDATKSNIYSVYTDVTLTLDHTTVKDFLQFLNLDATAPQVLDTIGTTTLDGFIFTSGNANDKKTSYVFKKNTISILQRLIQISNQTNPQIQYTIDDTDHDWQSDVLYKDIGKIFVTQRTYANADVPLCHKYTISGKSHTITPSFSDLDTNFGDTYKLYVGSVKETNIHLNLKNTLLLKIP